MPYVSIQETDLSRASRRNVAIFGNAKVAMIAVNGYMPSKIAPDARRRHAPLFLREWIEFRHMTGEQLAAHIGTSKSVISKLSTGKQRYNQVWLEMIAYHLQCEVPDLFRHPTSPDPGNILRAMPPHQRAIAIKAIEDIAKWGASEVSNAA